MTAPLDLPEHLFTAIDHVGIAVPDLDEAIAFYRDTFGMRVRARGDQRGAGRARGDGRRRRLRLVHPAARAALRGVDDREVPRPLRPGHAAARLPRHRRRGRVGRSCASAACACCTTPRGAARRTAGSTSSTPRTPAACSSSWSSPRPPARRTDPVGALVTGAGRGLGARIAALLAERGHVVHVTDVDLAAATEVAGTDRGGAFASVLDVRRRRRLRRRRGTHRRAHAAPWTSGSTTPGSSSPVRRGSRPPSSAALVVEVNTIGVMNGTVSADRPDARGLRRARGQRGLARRPGRRAGRGGLRRVQARGARLQPQHGGRPARWPASGASTSAASARTASGRRCCTTSSTTPGRRCRSPACC